MVVDSSSTAPEYSYSGIAKAVSVWNHFIVREVHRESPKKNAPGEGIGISCYIFLQLLENKPIYEKNTVFRNGHLSPFLGSITVIYAI
jgi:hypothetical protein